jgi:hypothetical protein
MLDPKGCFVAEAAIALSTPGCESDADYLLYVHHSSRPTFLAYPITIHDQ